MRRFDQEFREKLRETVEEIEQASGVEVVATIVPRVFRYWLVDFILASLLAFVVFTVMFFVETEFHYVLIYLEVVGTFVFGFLLLSLFPGLKRWMVGERRLQALAEMKSRAIFQENHMVETSRRTGVLFVFTFFERKAILLPDRGALELVPPDEWDKLRDICQEAFRSKDVAQAILDAMQAAKPIFAQYIPQNEEQINELPDELWLY